MAVGRILRRSLVNSKRWRMLYDLDRFVQSLFPLIVACSDNWGLLPADGLRLKAEIAPFDRSRSTDDFSKAVDALEDVGLVYVFENEEGDPWLYVAGHEAIQKEGIRKRKGEPEVKRPPVDKMEAEARSRAARIWAERTRQRSIPGTVPERRRNTPGTFPELSRDEVKGSEGKEKGRTPPGTIPERSGRAEARPTKPAQVGECLPPSHSSRLEDQNREPDQKEPGGNGSGAPPKLGGSAIGGSTPQAGSYQETMEILNKRAEEVARLHAETFGRRPRGLANGALRIRVLSAIANLGWEAVVCAVVGHFEECKANDQRGKTLRFAFPEAKDGSGVDLDRVADAADLGREVLEKENRIGKSRARRAKPAVESEPVELDPSNPFAKRAEAARNRRKENETDEPGENPPN